MVRFLLVGQDQKSLDQLKVDLKPLQDRAKDLKIATAKPGYIESLIDSHLKIMIFDTAWVNRMIFPFVVQIRKLGYTGPVLMLGSPASDFDVREISDVKNLFHLAKPYDQEQLLGLVKNCMEADQMSQRRDQRYDVRENARLEAYSSDFSCETVINNISRSGVRIEGKFQGIKEGDLLRLHFNFDKLNKERTMSARVVWVKKEGDKKEQAGLEFVSQKAVYQYLLQNASA